MLELPSELSYMQASLKCPLRSAPVDRLVSAASTARLRQSGIYLPSAGAWSNMFWGVRTLVPVVPIGLQSCGLHDLKDDRPRLQPVYINETNCYIHHARYVRSHFLDLLTGL